MSGIALETRGLGIHFGGLKAVTDLNLSIPEGTIFGLIGPNFGAMAMEPLGHVAGTASSVQGFVTTVIGALLGFYIGQHFNGTVVPLTLGFSLCGIAALVVVLIVEKGRLFHPAPGRS